MDATYRAALVRIFPGLAAEPFDETSDRTPIYNCIVWPAGDTEAAWWPTTPGWSWPPGVPREETFTVFQLAFAALGFRPCRDGETESGFGWIALYANDGAPRHAARQLPAGEWTSKLGGEIDITNTLAGLEGQLYGRVSAFLKRPTALIHPYEAADEAGVLSLWREALFDPAPHNDPDLSLRKKLAAADQLLLVAVIEGAVAGTVMGGWDGHRGWIYSVAVDSGAQAPRHRHGPHPPA